MGHNFHIRPACATPPRGSGITARMTTPGTGHPPCVDTTHYDLAIIGSGSGNTIVDEAFAGWRVAILERGVFGGTCLNRGCIPTKMFVYPADLAADAARGARLGVDTRFDGAHWREIRDRVFGRIDPISVAGRDWRATGSADVTLYESHARFVDARTLETGTGETITADRAVLAAGSHPTVPEIDGLADVPHHTSDTVMRIDELPERLLIIGGGFVAAEFAHVFGSFGSRVTLVNRSGALLRREDQDVSSRFTELAQRHWDVRLNSEVRKLEQYDGGLRAFLDQDGSESTLEFDTLLIATGRAANTATWAWTGPASGSTRPGWCSSTNSSAPAWTASGHSATSATATSSSTCPTTRPGWSGTTCCTRMPRSRHGTNTSRARCSPTRRWPVWGSPRPRRGPADSGS